jgi:urease accessory protein
MTFTRRPAEIVLPVLALLLWPAIASAHPMKGVGDFYAGMLHPMSGIQWVLPMLALSLLAGQQNRDSAIAVLGVFPVMLVTGAIIGLFIPLPPQVGLIDTALMIVLGILVAWGGRLHVWLSLSLSALLGLTVGAANGAEVITGVSAYRFIPGLALVGLLLVAYGIGLVRRLKAPWMQIGVRVVGSWIAAAGILAMSIKR